jgi:hypothetical protein
MTCCRKTEVVLYVDYVVVILPYKRVVQLQIHQHTCLNRNIGKVHLFVVDGVVVVVFVCLFVCLVRGFPFSFSPNDFAKAEIRLNIFSMAQSHRDRYLP